MPRPASPMSEASAAQPWAATTGRLPARRKLSAISQAKRTRPAVVAPAPANNACFCTAYMPAIRTIIPGTVSQNTSLSSQTAARARRVATARIYAAAPIAVVVRTPRVRRWTAASTGPNPPAKLVALPAANSKTSHSST